MRNFARPSKFIKYLCLIVLIFIIISPSFAQAESDPELIIETEFYLLFGNGGGNAVITVQGELAQDIRQDIFEEYGINSSNPQAIIPEVVTNKYVEAFEDLLELKINPEREFIDQEPTKANISFTGNFKVVKINRDNSGRVDVESISGLTGTSSFDSSKFTIKFKFEGEIIEKSEIILSDGYIILYALWGEKISDIHIKVKEISKITTVDYKGYSNQKLESGGNIKLYRLVLGNYLEYDHEYELSGYKLANNKKDTIEYNSNNIIQNSLLLFIIILIFSFIPAILSSIIVKKNKLRKVIHLRIVAIVFFILILIIYVIGIDGIIIWISTISLFIVNLILINGVYKKGWGNLVKVEIRREDFLKEPPKIEQGPWHERGIANAKVGNFDEAVNCFEMALETEPENPIIWNDLGFVQRKLGNYRYALDCFNKSLELRPEYPTAKENLNKTKKEMSKKAEKKLKSD